ncbi:hypothetical protein KGQ24_02615 [Patescibacteria group bacterium]|nr:hypothetical protein [Patescibacteria group bacterium]
MAEPARKLDGAQPQAPQPKPASASQPVGEIKIKRTLTFTPKPGRVVGSIGPGGKAAGTDGIQPQQNPQEEPAPENVEQPLDERPPQEQPESGAEQQNAQQPSPQEEQDPNQIPEPQRRGESPYYQGPPQEQHQPQDQDQMPQEKPAQQQKQPGAENPEDQGQQNPEEDQPPEENAPVSPQDAANFAAAAQQGQGAEAAKQAGEKLAGSLLVDILFDSMFTLILAPLAIIALDIYVFVGFFKKNPVWHQLKTWRMVVLVIFNILLALAIIILVIVIIYGVCSGFSGFVIKIMGVFSSSFSFCSELQKAGVLP